MSIIYTAKQVSPELQDAIAVFISTRGVTTATKREKVGAKRRAEARKAYLEKRELEHTRAVDLRG